MNDVGLSFAVPSFQVAINKSILILDFGHLILQVLDFWHPYEKAAYPEYFARREVRKREFVERWEKKYGQKVDFGHEWK